MPRCLYNSDFATFLYTDSASIYRILDDNYHGEALTTTRDAWKAEIDIMKNVVSSLNNVDGQIIFEYDIPRLGKRIDVDENLKARDMLRWVAEMNNIKASAEEIVLREVVLV